MSKIQEAFDAGNYAQVRKLAAENPTPEAQKLMDKIKTDPKIIWAGLFALIFAAVMSFWVLH